MAQMNAQEIHDLRVELLSDLMAFTQFFFKVTTNRDFTISYPKSRPSHHTSIVNKLELTLEHKVNRLIINCPPRYGKTELCVQFVAWALANYPDSNFLCVSYSLTLAATMTQKIREIISHPVYKELFGIQLKDSSRAKSNFETTAGGSVYAAGSGGTITGKGAGIAGVDRFGGAVIIDDIHKPDDATSDTIRGGICDWYLNTMYSRVNSKQTPVVFIGQIVHEDDLASRLKKGFDGKKWDVLSTPALDEHQNALMPSKHDTEELLRMQEVMPYVFSSQYQQNPSPAGGSVFKKEWFVILDDTPEILGTFITADTAETDKEYNDATVFSFWGVYETKYRGVGLGTYSLHWIDCTELWCEPFELEDNFMAFYTDCLRYKVPPQFAAIEKASTGTTLLSCLKKTPGINVREIKRDRASKTTRLLNAQEYAASGRVSLPTHGKHTDKCIDHMTKITANNTHRRDDIADTYADACKFAFENNAIKLIIRSKTETAIAPLKMNISTNRISGWAR